ncbi:GntR family transcriptional regulator of arabinose operon [Paenibacillus sp. V4I3]|uniref:GntR family transcriptional regulator n=1 Tax=unclassified Paenibacillus TaxID=185978 RepID=UPI00277DA536|nr:MULTISPECIES: substrate-binding domain-containing protein [unclassified Paenibacillus]MDQ0877880.1 GntR family transcriptional regulator of arabinose operon [Paenibacillus sp. V4I3]MDQ0886296.1 GntR family transcriptional regulator of arabinose operon [Paenibacillus sp. V4I9]
MNNERQPLYMVIQEHFKRLITTGQLAADDKIPTEKELMEEFHVSRITVANALTQLAKDGWIYRIPGRGSFVQSKSMPQPVVQYQDQPKVIGLESNVVSGESYQPLSTNRRRMIGFLIPSLEDYFALRLIQGINSILDESRYYLAIVLTKDNKDREKEAIMELIHKGAEGLIIFPIDAETYNEEILAMKIRNYPFVLIDRNLPGVETHVVSSDNFMGIQLAVSHLWDLGHRDIAIVTDSPLSTTTVEGRIAGYMEALKQKNALINPAFILTEFRIDYNKGVDDQHPLYRYIRNKLATAYITLNAKLGLHIAAIAQRLELSVPDELSILTFDDPSSGEGETRAFTHVAQSEAEIGRQAAEVLIGLLDSDGEGDGKYHKIILQPKLVVGKSTGPLKK